MLQQSYAVVSWLFLRGFAVIYGIAFASMAVQIDGLLGSSGILPVQSFLPLVKQNLPEHYFAEFPSLFWFDASDFTLQLTCWLGMLCALLCLMRVAERITLALCYGLYLSVVSVGQDFTAFQWDLLVLETGFLALLLTGRSVIIIFLFRWLIARFMLMAGVVKIASGDSSWHDLTALSYHFETEPLPTPIAYYAHFWPPWLQESMVAAVLLIELVLPFCVFLTRPLRLLAAWSFILLQIVIILTGNYNFFNLLTILLCLFLFDDRDLKACLPAALLKFVPPPAPSSTAAQSLAVIWLIVVLLCSSCALITSQGHIELPRPLQQLLAKTSALGLFNHYGPFAVMTRTRPEIIIEGSNDNQTWQAYEFNYKPVHLNHPLRWNIPHQPRLDWQMWFAALSKPDADSWFVQFLLALLDGSKPVTALLAHNPFAEHPPKYIRASLYRYRYNPPAARASTGNIWQREYLGEYWPKMRKPLALVAMR